VKGALELVARRWRSGEVRDEERHSLSAGKSLGSVPPPRAGRALKVEPQRHTCLSRQPHQAGERSHVIVRRLAAIVRFPFPARRCRCHAFAERSQSRVERALAQQQGDELVIQLERVSEERSLWLVGLGDKVDQLAVNKRRARSKARPVEQPSPS
jgi:hypothetical protein